jgi:DNA-binding XRE family transcriptional regulator
MKKHKIEKEFTYTGLGFPVILKNVPMIELRGVWGLDINLNTLQKVVLIGLSQRQTELTGNQIRFIRSWFELTQVDFGNLLGVTHPAVVKWEKSADKIAKITLTTQRDLRLLILDQLLNTDEDFRNAFRNIHNLKFTQGDEPLTLNIPIDLIAI